MGKIKVLYIDDEIANLNAFTASFRRQFDIYTGTSADQGLEILKNIPIEVVISDQRMPIKSGIDFFDSLLELYPNPIRILLTAYSDIDAVIDAINRGNVYRYVSKPWDEYDLRLTIENAYQLHQLREKNNRLNLKYRKVFSDSSDPILILDSAGRIIEFNKAAVNFISEEKQQLKLLSIHDIIKDDSEEFFENLKNKEAISDSEFQIYAKNNEVKDCLISANEITSSHSEIINYQAIIKDVTQRSKTNQLILKNTIETQEIERERISRDLHDGIGQSLAAIKLHLEFVRINASKNKPIDSELNIISSILNDSIHDLRTICSNTLPIVLKEYGLVNAIKELQINLSNIDFVIKFNFDENFPVLLKSLQISIFRIVQEFINNSIKHSEGTEVNIILKNNLEYVILHLNDNGVGFNIQDVESFSGFGLKNIQSRISSFKGKIEMKSILESGTEFNITLPRL